MTPEGSFAHHDEVDGIDAMGNWPLPQPGEIHQGTNLGLQHAGALALEGRGVSGSAGTAPSMDRVSSGGEVQAERNAPKRTISRHAMQAVKKQLKLPAFYG